MWRLLLVLLWLAGGASAPAGSAAQVAQGAPVASTPEGTAGSPLIEAQTRELASELRCPVCQGVSIEDSPTELARQMKSVIRGQLREGKAPEQVRAYFVSRYGEWILLRPEARGFNLAVYLLPIAMLLVGAGVIVWSVRRWTRPPAGQSAGVVASDGTAVAPEPEAVAPNRG